MTTDNQPRDTCTSCGVPFMDHGGIIRTCAELQRLKVENVTLRAANQWYEWNQVSREIWNGDIWWHDNGEQVYPVNIAWSPTTLTFFATMGQWGWGRAQDLSEMGGRWMPCVEPEPDKAFRDSVRPYFQE